MRFRQENLSRNEQHFMSQDLSYFYMNKFNVFVVLSILAAASLFAAIAMVTPVVAQDNMSMTMDNSTMPMDHIGNMTMTMDNSTGMTGNSTTQ